MLSLRDLNRTTLERQLLLRRANLSALEAMHHLAGLNAQDPNLPYLSLWSRLAEFHQDDLTELLYDRSVVRSSVLRRTQHMVTAADYLWLRPLVQPILERGRQAAFGRRTAGVDLAELAAAARGALTGRTLTRPALGRLLADRWSESEPGDLAWSVQYLVPLVHPPPSGTWGTWGATPFTLAEEWIGRALVTEPSPEELIRRYLAAFGPASVMDIQTWCGLTKLGDVVERLRPHLRVSRDESGTELFDLPDAQMIDPDTPAPPRFLPDCDNLLTAHADRTRIMTDEHRRRVCVGAVVAATVIVDGFVTGTWSMKRNAGTAVLDIKPFAPLAPDHQSAVTDEGARLLRFAAPDAGAHDIRFAVV